MRKSVLLPRIIDQSKKRIILRNLNQFTDKDASIILKQHPHTEILEIRNCPLLEKQSLRLISTLPLTTLLWVDMAAPSPKDYLSLARLGTTLQHLSLSGCPSVNASIVNELTTTLPHLRCLDLSFCPIEEDAFETVCSPLVTLNLQGCSLISDRTLLDLAQIKTLKNLFLAFNDRLSSQGIQLLKKMNLSTLRIYHRHRSA